MFNLEHPKWVLSGDRLIMGRVILHKDLLRDNSETIGGGWWHYDSEKKIMYLYGKSEDFGTAPEELVRLAWEDTTHAENGIQLVFSHETSLVKVLHPEPNARLSYTSKEGERVELGLAHMHVPLHIGIPDHHIGVDLAHRKEEPATVQVFSGGRGSGKLRKVGIIGHKTGVAFALTQQLHMNAFGDVLDPKAVVTLFPKMNEREVEKGSFDVNSEIHKIELQRSMEVPTLNPSRKKKPCTSHEYTYREEDRSTRLIRGTWKCRHCEHPLK